MYKYFICIDVGKFTHWANVMTPEGEILVDPFETTISNCSWFSLRNFIKPSIAI